MPDALRLRPLTPEAFAPFGDVIAAAGQAEIINSGMTRKFADQARIDVECEGGRPAVHIYRSAPTALPLTVTMLERHPLGSQAFMPLQDRPWIVIVAPPTDIPDRGAICAFLAHGLQGVNLARGVWHHPQVSLEEAADYLVIDRAGPGENCDIHSIERPLIIRSLETERP
ncbi:ureidoglycolate lyase [Elongatibacter sediminis]|uniref:Ureidoglycolate lyase n=1 Tax=Elongatibacter sediminis TaxID=3119006 RepID=A0AAW9RHP5_9GAMM